MDELRPDAVVVVGDVNSTLACVVVAAKAGCLVGHVEAGLWRSDLGRAVPDALRRLLGCDGRVRPVREVCGVALSVGRTQRIVPERTRLVIEQRDGATDTANLVTLRVTTVFTNPRSPHRRDCAPPRPRRAPRRRRFRSHRRGPPSETRGSDDPQACLTRPAGADWLPRWRQGVTGRTTRWCRPLRSRPAGPAARGGDALNDDRVGRTLARLFDADRASLLTEVVLSVIRNFGIDCSQLHNDSTSVSFTGVDYPGGGRPRGGKAVPAVTFGHNKDHRPDLRQLVWILTVSADGAVPIAYRVESGNTNDDVTHVATWDELVALLRTTDFLYVSDCKLASADAMGHIDSHGGRFVTVLPANRREVTRFAEWIQDHTPDWAEAARRPGRRLGDPPEIWRTFESPMPSDGGFRIIWVHSSTKAINDAATRARRIAAGMAAMEELAARLAGPRCRYKTQVAVETAAARALIDTDAEPWIDATVTPVATDTFRQEKRGRRGVNTRYRKTTTERFQLDFAVRAEAVAYDARTDGIFPLITNDKAMTPPEVLAKYKYQPNLERRHGQLKGHQLVAPVLLKDPVRIEGLLCCHFFALVVQALIEREIRTAMIKAEARHIPLYPELRACAAPSAASALEIFATVSRHHLISDGQLVQIFEPELTPLQLQVLDLLGVPASAYLSPTN